MGEPEETGLGRPGRDLDELGFDLGWVEGLAISEVICEVGALLVDEFAVLLQNLPALPGVQVTDLLLGQTLRGAIATPIPRESKACEVGLQRLM